ncbi:MAG TPA: phosphate-starvation-inducible PsiE family protein [Candidatus Limnocylindrales bacterium]|nr:phosphate-starvation-inducible PsiE family protein [Candidatus Limnocylindrales bacterium]
MDGSAGYPQKRPRTRGHHGAVGVIEWIEDGIYVVVAILLVVAGALVLWSAMTTLYDEITAHTDPVQIVINVLDRGLVLFIIAELLHTVRVTVQARRLAAEPFLIVAIIAGIRRILILTAQAAQQGTSSQAGNFHWNPQGIELALLTTLVIVMTVAVILWRRYYVPLAAGDDSED